MAAPIALFAYNRPDHLGRVAQALASNPEAAQSRLYIFSDAPKRESDAPAVASVRAFANNLAGFADLEVIGHHENQGVARSIISGVSRLVSEFGTVIVLEDDLVPGPHFLRYMNDALQRYADDERVIGVHAYCYPVPEPLPETYFLRGADCWGWATWKRGWDLFEPDGRKLLAALEAQGESRDFDFDGSYPYTSMLRDCIAGRNDSWAIRWYASAFLRGKLTLYPGVSQVQNIGADGSGIHVGSTALFQHARWGRKLELAPIPVQESIEARRAFARYLAGLRPSLGARVLQRIGRLVGARSA
jgi:hypothetical protein